MKETAIASEADYWVARSELVQQGLVKGERGRQGGLSLLAAKEQEKGVEEGKLSERARKLWILIPSDGSFVTNQSLRNKLRPLGFSTEDFWTYRKELLDAALIQIRRGRGGSVARIPEHVKELEVKAPKGVLVKDEEKLYDEQKKWLLKNKVSDVEQSGGQAWVVVTGEAGKWKRRSGHWSRPDVVSVEVTTYEYLRQRDVVVTTYEIKRYTPQMDNSWVFEAASHSKGAHHSYLVVETIEEKVTDEPPEELFPDLRQFGIGFGWLYLNSKTKEYEFNEVLEPDRKQPIPEDENNLLKHFATKLKTGELTAFKHAIV